MELAKIRSKAKQQEQRFDAPAPPGDENRPAPEESVVPPAVSLPQTLADDATTTLVVPGPVPSRLVMTAARFDPLAVILAGRQADQQAAPAHDSGDATDSSSDSERYQEFLCFLLGGEEYGINIMEIKEIIKPRELTEVPRAPHFIDGIISLRGVIVPVINLRRRLGLAATHATPHERIVIVRRGENLSGLRVDAVTGVVRIADHRREATPAVLEGVDREFVAGIGRSDNRMVILLDVQHAADAGPHPGER